MASLLQENEFLKSELEAYKQELITVREAYGKELNLYTLAHAASATEKSTKKDQYNEYMCSQSGNIYHQAGYKIVEVPLPGATPVSTSIAIKEERPAVTKELAGPSNIFEKEVKPQIPQPTVLLKLKVLYSGLQKLCSLRLNPGLQKLSSLRPAALKHKWINGRKNMLCRKRRSCRSTNGSKITGHQETILQLLSFSCRTFSVLPNKGN